MYAKYFTQQKHLKKTGSTREGRWTRNKRLGNGSLGKLRPPAPPPSPFVSLNDVTQSPDITFKTLFLCFNWFRNENMEMTVLGRYALYILIVIY